MIFMNTENSKTNEPHKLVFNLSDRLEVRSSNKHALQNLSSYCKWKNMRKQYNISQLWIKASAWNYEF